MGFKIIDLNNIIIYINKILDKKFEELDFLELGEQEFKITFEERDNTKNENLKKFILNSPRNFKKNDKRLSFFTKDYLKTIFKSVDSVDKICKCKNTYKLNLGKNLEKQKFNKIFDIINNNGTTEHVGEFKEDYETKYYNPQYEVFKNIHDSIRVNGLVFNCVPYLGMNHGAYNYDLIFFEDLAKFNNYKIIYLFKKLRGKIMHTYCCFQKKNIDSFINIETFKKIRGLEKKREIN